MGLAARLAASTPIVVQPATSSASAQPAPAPSMPAQASAAPLVNPPSYDQSTAASSSQNPFGDVHQATCTPPLHDQKVASSPSPLVQMSYQQRPPAQRSDSVISNAPSSNSASVKRKSSLFKNPFRRNSSQADPPAASSSSQQQQRPLPTVFSGQQQMYAPPPGPPTSALRQAQIDRSINKTGEFRLTEAQVEDILEHTADDQGLRSFYPRGSMKGIARRVAQSNALTQLAVTWGLPREIAADLVALALFDTVICCDDSGSMAFEEDGERIKDMQLIVERVALAASLFDDDGISVRFLNSPVKGDGIKDAQDALNLISQVRFQGLTPLGTALDDKIVQPMILRPAKAGRLQKPVNVVIVTDGTPQGEPRDKILRVIMQANKELSRTRYGADALSLSISQVGNDLRARAFLEELDVHPVVGGLIDCTSNYELEADEMLRKSGVELMPSVWIVKVLLGGISTAYDAADE